MIDLAVVTGSLKKLAIYKRWLESSQFQKNMASKGETTDIASNINFW